MSRKRGEITEGLKPEPIVFTHCPKTAGTSLYSGLFGTVDPARFYKFRGVRSLLLGKGEGFDVMGGHVPWGIHTFLPGEVRYITMLRDPVERARSHYYFILEEPKFEKYRHSNIKQRKVHKQELLTSLFDATRHKRFRLFSSWLIDNMQTRYIAGWQNYWRGASSSKLLSIAKRNLEQHYATFGIQEDFDRSLEHMAGVLSLKVCPIRERRKATGVKPVLTEAEFENVVANNQLDIELYAFAKELFESRVS